VLRSALNAYFAELDDVTLADLLPPARTLSRAMAMPTSRRVVKSSGKSLTMR
jgi:hypothetical protein